jgi:hypothetical protein
MTEYFSNCGIGVILHIHALTRSDWKFWELVLSRHSNVKFVTHEFQTGGQKWNDGVAFLERVAAMQDSLNRPLHMVAIGGGQFAPVLARLFAQFTIVDSTPFMKTLKRQRLIPRAVRRPAWRRQRTDPGEFLDDLLFHNVVMYRRWMQTRIEGEKDRIGVGA